LVADGRSNGTIATRLVMAESTVEAHVSAIFANHRPEVSRDQHRRLLAVLTLLRA
jgi:ATP/maltotriose-dependent transcriptional regulator MalT